MRRLYGGFKVEIILRSILIKKPGIFHNSANNRESWLRKSDYVTLGKMKMTCYHMPDEKTLQIFSLYFVPTLQSAVYILYPVCSLQSAFCRLKRVVVNRTWKKFQARTGFEPMTSAIPVQCSTNWANKPTGSWTGITEVMGSNPVRAWIFFRSYLQLLVSVVFLAARIS